MTQKNECSSVGLSMLNSAGAELMLFQTLNWYFCDFDHFKTQEIMKVCKEKYSEEEYIIK